MDPIIDVSSLSLEDVREEYGILYERYRQMCVASEKDAQRIYELKRHLDTALAAEEYLTQELEQFTNNDSTNTTIKANQAQFNDLQREHAKLQLQFNALQTFSEETVQKNEILASQLEEMKSDKLHKKETDEENNMANLAATERAERLRLLEKENLELLQKLDELQEENVRHVMQINDRENTVEMLRERLLCVEENLRSKYNELEEKTQMLESAQEQLFEANGRIAQLTATPESAERKGNSLFAEVDDQRQVMKQLLAAQKRSYMEMKKTYQESQYEIRRLKHENIAMHNELDACSTLFCSSNKTYQTKLLQRLLHVNNEKDLLERHLQLMHKRLRDLTNDKGMGWLDSMLNFCKQETDDLKKQVHSSRLQQASLEEQLRNISQEMARWRFEALKSRCLLLDRENLLNNNNISFKANNAIEFRISEADLLEAHPRIMTKRNSIETTTVPKPIEVAKIEEESVEAQTISKQEITKTICQVEISEDVIENQQETFEGTTVMEVQKVLEEAKAEEPLSLEINENKENLEILPNVQDNLTNKVKSSTHSSILSNKPHNLLLYNDVTKSVKFSESPPTVHNLSVSETTSAEKERSIVTTQTFKQMRNNKSGLIVVRNVVFKPSSIQQKQQNNS